MMNPIPAAASESATTAPAAASPASAPAVAAIATPATAIAEAEGKSNTVFARALQAAITEALVAVPANLSARVAPVVIAFGAWLGRQTPQKVAEWMAMAQGGPGQRTQAHVFIAHATPDSAAARPTWASLDSQWSLPIPTTDQQAQVKVEILAVLVPAVKVATKAAAAAVAAGL